VAARGQGSQPYRRGRVGLAFSLGFLALAGLSAARGQSGAAPDQQMEDPALARSDYLEHCAGCHGVSGSTAPAQLPELRGRVGWFMCTPQARAYLLRLPNVAQSRIKDNAELANMMNFVVFVLGNGSAPAGTKPFTAEEVARERQLALTTTALTVERARHADAVIRKCHAPASLRLLYPAQGR
jgi:hypothetical protein